MLNICIIEDENLIALDLHNSFCSMGHQVCGITDNFDDAVNMALEVKPDLFIVDINICGDRDGIEFASYLSCHHTYEIIFYSSFPESHYKERLENVKYLKYLVKPASETDFMELLKSVNCKHTIRN